MTLTQIGYSVQSILLVAVVLLSGTHAKDVIRPYAVKHHAAVTTVHIDDGTNKVSSELHPHVDKQSLKTFYHSNSTQHHADRRSLELLENSIHSLKAELKLGWTLWWRLAAAKLLF